MENEIEEKLKEASTALKLSTELGEETGNPEMAALRIAVFDLIEAVVLMQTKMTELETEAAQLTVSVARQVIGFAETAKTADLALAEAIMQLHQRVSELEEANAEPDCDGGKGEDE